MKSNVKVYGLGNAGAGMEVIQSRIGGVVARVYRR